jgi:hypothetical protein
MGKSMSQKKTATAREARRIRNRQKKSATRAKADVFQAVRQVVNAQKQLDENAKKLGILEEETNEDNKEGQEDTDSNN